MNILIVPDRMEIRGGLETHVISLAQEWSKKNKGHKVLVYSNAISPEIRKELAGCSLYSGWNDKSTKYMINEFKPDIIVAHPFSGIDLGYKIYKQVKDSKLFPVMHGDYSTGLTNEIVEAATEVICVSKTAFQAVKYKCPIEKISLIYNGINTKDFYPTKPSKIIAKKVGISQEYMTIVAVSRLDDGKEKAVYQLLNVAKELSKRIGGLNIVIVGGGSHYEAIKKKADELDGQEWLNVKAIGEQQAVRSYINLADIVLGCDRVALEAILCKKNVFYMGLSSWKGLIKNDNFNDLIFSKTGFVEYTNEQLILHLTWMLLQKPTINKETDKLFNKINHLCNLERVAQSYMDKFKGTDKKKE